MLEFGVVKLRGSFVGLVSVALCVRCVPDLDALSQDFGHPRPSGASGSGGSAGLEQGEAGGTVAGGTAGGSGGGSSGKGGSHAKAGTGGGVNAAGTGGSNEGGQSGANQGGEGGAEGGQAGSGETQGGAPSAGTTSGGTTSTGASGGVANEGGGAGAGPNLPCTDGCALLDIPPDIGFSQFFTINLDLTNGVDLSDSVLTAHLRTIDFTGTTETIQFYASATGFAFFNNNNATVELSSLSDGGTLTMDLTSTGTWDNTHVISFGFLLHGGSTAVTNQVLVEDISVAVKADPEAMPKVGPWLFTKESDVNEATAETIDTMYSTPNVIFANPYMPVTGAQAIWVPPG